MNLKQNIQQLSFKNEDKIKICLNKQILTELTQQTFTCGRFVSLFSEVKKLLSTGYLRCKKKKKNGEKQKLENMYVNLKKLYKIIMMFMSKIMDKNRR